MFCPECGYEYRDGFTVCPDCDVALSNEPPVSDDGPVYAEYVEVLDTFNPFDIAIIKSMLDAEGIEYYFIGENFGGIYPMATAPRLMVIKDKAQDASEFLKDLSLTYLASHSPEEEEEEEDEPSTDDGSNDQNLS